MVIAERVILESKKTQCQKVKDCLFGHVEDGIRHGFFDFSVTCEIVNGKKRRVTIKAGKNHQFTIPAEELE